MGWVSLIKPRDPLTPFLGNTTTEGTCISREFNAVAGSTMPVNYIKEDPNALFGEVLDLSTYYTVGAAQGIVGIDYTFTGKAIFPTNQSNMQIGHLIAFKVPYTGFPGGSISLFGWNGLVFNNRVCANSVILQSDGSLRILQYNDLGQVLINNTAVATNIAMVADEIEYWYFQYDLTYGASGYLKIYRNGTLIATENHTSSQGYRSEKFYPDIVSFSLGGSYLIGNASMDVAFVGTYEGVHPSPGTMSPGGAIDAEIEAIEETASGVNVPSESQVLSGVEYDDGLTSYTGTLTLPATGNVKQGIQYGAGGTQYTGGLWVPGLTSGSGTWAPQEVQKEIYLLLSNDDDMIDLLGGDSGTDDTTDKIFDYVPDNEDTPYVVLKILPWLDRGNHSFDGMECEFQISVWYQPGEGNNTNRGNKPVQEIQERIDALLHKTELCVDGWNSLQLRRSYIDIETQDDNVTKHGIQRFTLMIGEK